MSKLDRMSKPTVERVYQSQSYYNVYNENEGEQRKTPTRHTTWCGTTAAPRWEQGGLPGMIDPANPVQFGHYPAVGDTTARYDAGGPRLGKDDGTRMFNFQVPADSSTKCRGQQAPGGTAGTR